MSAATTEIPCPKCGAKLELSCGEHMPDGNLDLTLHCEDDCGMMTLNAFVSLTDFAPVE